MNNIFLQSWWVLALRGVLGILFGVLALLWPGLTLVSLIALFAAFALLSGVVAVIGAFRHRHADDNWWLLLTGLVGIGAGVIAVFNPTLTALVLVLVIGANALITGVLDIAAAIRLRKQIEGEWLLILSGLASVAFGVMVFLFPAAGALALVWLISLYAFVTGILLLGLSFRVRRLAHGTGRPLRERRVNPDRRGTPAHP